MVREALGGGGLLLPFAIGSAVAALLEYFSPGSITWQWVAFFGLGSVLLVAWVRLKRRRGFRTIPRHGQFVALACVAQIGKP